MHGAWAGEIGQTQFLPSSYLKYAVDVDGNRNGGDLINSPEDALASTANFLHANGWQRGAGWDEGQPNFAALLEWNKAHGLCEDRRGLRRQAGGRRPATTSSRARDQGDFGPKGISIGTRRR